MSLVPAPMRAAMTLIERLANEVLTKEHTLTLEGITTHATMNNPMTS